MSSSLNASSSSSTPRKSLFGMYDPLSAPTKFVYSRSNHDRRRRKSASVSVTSSKKVHNERQSAIATNRKFKENFAPKSMLDSQTDSQAWLDNLLSMDGDDVKPDLTPTMPAPLERVDSLELAVNDGNQDLQHALSSRNNLAIAPPFSSSSSIKLQPEADGTKRQLIEAAASLNAAHRAGFTPQELLALLRDHCLNLVVERDQFRGECIGLRVEHDKLVEENRRLKEVCQGIGHFIHKQLNTI